MLTLHFLDLNPCLLLVFACCYKMAMFLVLAHIVDAPHWRGGVGGNDSIPCPCTCTLAQCDAKVAKNSTKSEWKTQKLIRIVLATAQNSTFATTKVSDLTPFTFLHQGNQNLQQSKNQIKHACSSYFCILQLRKRYSIEPRTWGSKMSKLLCTWTKLHYVTLGITSVTSTKLSTATVQHHARMAETWLAICNEIQKCMDK